MSSSLAYVEYLTGHNPVSVVLCFCVMFHLPCSIGLGGHEFCVHVSQEEASQPFKKNRAVLVCWKRMKM